MRRSLRSALLAVACGVTMAPAAGYAQQVVVSTFGPGDSYNHAIGWIVSSDQQIAQSFLYGGPNGVFLEQIRLALFDAGRAYEISFLTGNDRNTATLLESWLASPPTGGGIASVSSVLMPALVSGNTYWVSAFNGANGAWNWNDQGINGVTLQLAAAAWSTDSGSPSAAYDVTTSAPLATPEPASLMLLGTGMIGMVVPVLRRRMKAA